MRKTFSVPILPYLKKYVVKKFFAGLQQPYKIEEDSLLGKQFMSLILDARSKDLRGDKKIEMSDTLKIELSEAMAERSPNIVKLIPINFYLDKLFKADVITWIQSADEFGIRPYVSSKAFLAFYRIDETEYSHDACYQFWTRSKRQGYRTTRMEKKDAATVNKINRTNALTD